MDYKIIKVTANDVEKLSLISRETFTDTFGNETSAEDLNQYLDVAYNNDKLLKEINNPETEFQFILYDNQIAGYLKLNVGDAQSEDEGNHSLEVERIYIRKHFKRNGLGTILIDYSIDEAKTLNKDFVWLGVWEHNDPALKFYEKMGFKAFSEHVFQVGNDRQRDILMKKAL